MSTSGNTDADQLNARFHTAYDKALSDDKVPVLIVLAEALVLRNGPVRQEIALAPPEVHLRKSVAHVPIALYVLLRDGKVPHAALERIGKRLAALDEALHADALDTLRQIVGATRKCWFERKEGDFGNSMSRPAGAKPARSKLSPAGR